MEFRIEATYLNEVHVIVPELFSDERGFFGETFRADRFSGTRPSGRVS